MVTDVAAVHVVVDVHVVHPPTIEPDQFHHRGEQLMDQLMCLEDNDPCLADMDLAGDAGTRTWTIGMLIRTDDPFEAIVKATSAIRAALHGLGDATPDWPTAEDLKTAFQPSVVQTERTLVPA